MNNLAKERVYTLKELAQQLGCAYSTVAGYASKFGWTESGKVTYLNENQATAILEAMKSPVSSGTKNNLTAQLEGTETSKSKEFKLAMLYKQTAELEKELRLEAEAKLHNEVVAHKGTKILLADEQSSHKETKADLDKTEECSSWLLHALRNRGDEVMKQYYGDDLPYWAK
jgi:hypothetical protein